jgi:predicted metalloendopeptidase
MLQNRIVYNTISPDWRSPASIKAFYEGFELDQNSFYNAKRSISVYKKDKLWKSLTSKYTKNQWDAKGYPHKVNAFYNLILNEVSQTESFLVEYTPISLCLD